MISSYLMEPTDFMMDMIRKPEVIHEFMDGVTPMYIELARLYQEAGADILTFHDGGASTDCISPKNYRDLFLNPLKSG